MNIEQTPPPAAPPIDPQPPLKSGRRHIPNLLGWMVGIMVAVGLAGVIFPFSNQTCAKGVQTKALAQAKQIGLALRLFAGDHDGNYPRAGLPAMLGAEVNDSNAAFAVLFPAYVQNEAIFGNKLSVYQTRQPDNQISPYDGKPGKTLEPGENVDGYVAGLTDNPDDGVTPLVVDGTDGTGHYTTDPKKRGGLWGGNKAIVIHLDNSGAVETLTGPDHARYIPHRDPQTHADQGNLLDVSSLGPDVRLLDPAVGSR